MDGKTSIADELVFPSESGTFIDPGNLYARYFLPAVEHSGLRRFGIHDLRYAFASMLFQDGARWSLCELYRSYIAAFVRYRTPSDGNRIIGDVNTRSVPPMRQKKKKKNTRGVGGSSANQQARWILLADIALGRNGNGTRRSPGSKAIDDHKLIAREIERLVSKYWSRRHAALNDEDHAA